MSKEEVKSPTELPGLPSLPWACLHLPNSACGALQAKEGLRAVAQHWGSSPGAVRRGPPGCGDRAWVRCWTPVERPPRLCAWGW